MNQQTDSDRQTSGFHPVNIAHLVMGLVLLGAVGVWALVEGGVVANDDLRWLLPVPWVLAGGVGLLAAAVTGPKRYAVQQSGWVGTSDAREQHEEPEVPEEPAADEPPTTPDLPADDETEEQP
jgi:hypothetical protein